MHGAIDRTHISIREPLGPFLEDYYYHELVGCNIIVQSVVDCNK
jgi:ribosomal 30S subunit maturation factor RimM